MLHAGVLRLREIAQRRTSAVFIQPAKMTVFEDPDLDHAVVIDRSPMAVPVK